MSILLEYGLVHKFNNIFNNNKRDKLILTSMCLYWYKHGIKLA